VRHGILNAGTGQSKSFNDVACALKNIHGGGRVEYIPFPERLKARYQSFTEADIANLRATGYTEQFTSLNDGINQTLLSEKATTGS
jgi:ADP-L-glycero-D-manno-heptose 6-epimerase